MFKTYVLPIFSNVAYSRCCLADDEKMKRARLRLLPRNVKKPFADFSAWRHGHDLPLFSTYVHAQRARMLPYVKLSPRQKWMLAPSLAAHPIQQQRSPDVTLIAETIRKHALAPGPIHCASDASFSPRDMTGSIGICVEKKTFGYNLTEPIASSTAGEQLGALVLQKAILESGVPVERLRPMCDNKGVTQQCHNHKTMDNPRSLCTEKDDVPTPVQWHKGHAGNVFINRADKAAASANTPMDTRQLCAPGRHVTNILEFSVQHGRGASARPARVFTQSSEASRFVKSMVQLGYDALFTRTATLVPNQIIYSRRIRSKLLQINGAHDLFQAFAGHALLPEQSSLSRERKRLCPSCRAVPLSAKHVLFARDKRHTDALRQRFPSAPRPPTRTQFWDTMRTDTHFAMAHAARIALTYESDDTLIAFWARSVLQGISRSH